MPDWTPHMDEPVTVPVTEVVGGPFAVASEDGQLVYEQVLAEIRQGRTVVVSFLGIETLISAFLNTAIGQLYGSLPEEKIQKHLRVEGLNPFDDELLKRVVDNAKRYFANPALFDQSWREVHGATE